jgi:hypothetical protein
MTSKLPRFGEIFNAGHVLRSDCLQGNKKVRANRSSSSRDQFSGVVFKFNFGGKMVTFLFSTTESAKFAGVWRLFPHDYVIPAVNVRMFQTALVWVQAQIPWV